MEYHYQLRDQDTNSILSTCGHRQAKVNEYRLSPPKIFASQLNAAELEIVKGWLKRPQPNLTLSHLQKLLSRLEAVEAYVSDNHSMLLINVTEIYTISRGGEVPGITRFEAMYFWNTITLHRTPFL